MKLNEDFMKNFRWITPVMVSITAILVTVLIFVITSLITAIRTVESNLTTELRGVRTEVKETRQFAVEYTNTMIGLIVKTGGKEAIKSK